MLFRCSSIVLVALAAICISTLANASSPGNTRSREARASPSMQYHQGTQPATTEIEMREKFIKFRSKEFEDSLRKIHPIETGDNDITEEDISHYAYKTAKHAANYASSAEIEKYVRDQEARQSKPTNPRAQPGQDAQPATTETEMRKKFIKFRSKEFEDSLRKTHPIETGDNDITEEDISHYAYKTAKHSVNYASSAKIEKYVRDQEARQSKLTDPRAQPGQDAQPKMETVRRTTRAGPSSQPVQAQPATTESEIRKAAEKHYFEDMKTKMKNSKAKQGDNRDLTGEEYSKAKSEAKKYAQSMPIATLKEYIKEKGN